MTKITTYDRDQIEGAIQANDRLLFVHFTSSLASSSQVVHRDLEELVPQFTGQVEFAEVEVALSDLGLIQSRRLEQLPTLVLFHRDREVERLDTLLGAEDLAQFLRDALSYYTALQPEGDAKP